MNRERDTRELIREIKMRKEEREMTIERHVRRKTRCNCRNLLRTYFSKFINLARFLL